MIELPGQSMRSTQAQPGWYESSSFDVKPGGLIAPQLNYLWAGAGALAPGREVSQISIRFAVGPTKKRA